MDHSGGTPQLKMAEKTAGHSFAAALRHAMTVRRVTGRRLAEMTGLTSTMISKARNPKHHVSFQAAVLLAKALDCEELAVIVGRERTQRCLICRRRFIHVANHPQKYCSISCSNKQRGRRTIRRTAHQRGDELKVLRDAIAAHCAWCEPDGICKDAECALRGVSPLPLIALTRKRVA